jgi:hypothetical protein
MKAFISLALCLLATVAQAQGGPQAYPGAGAKAERPKSFKMTDIQRKPTATVAVAFTDDWEALTLPPFATRTTALPIRFLRIAVQRSF